MNPDRDPVRPPVRHVSVDPVSFVLVPDPGFGPVGLILGHRTSDGAHLATPVHALALLLLADDDGRVDLNELPPSSMTEVALMGWPDEWNDDHVGWAVVGTFTAALRAGHSWACVRESAYALVIRLTAAQN